MKKDDVKLIQNSLAGDEDAFAMLVRKYQRQVHALAWRKTKDFHIAEEITQDTFLIAYQKLATLKNPNCFAGWINRIATRQCFLTQRKERIQIRPLNDTDIKRMKKMTYSQYVADEQAKAATEAQHDVIQKLLARLPERERTVLTLYYFKEMTYKEIGQFLGVSTNTVKSRIHRALHRLKRWKP